MKHGYVALLALLFALSIGCSKDPDPCSGISCVNSGNCINGSCLCPDQWTGPDCSQEKTPIKMRVGSIKLTTFPPTDDNGGGWDVLDGADVFLVISKGSDILLSTTYIQNLTTSHEWTTNFEFTDPTATYTISVYDYDDFSDNDFMGGINFTPYRKNLGFPTSYLVNCGNCVVAFELKNVVYFHL
jgi:hypothetical protein